MAILEEPMRAHQKSQDYITANGSIRVPRNTVMSWCPATGQKDRGGSFSTAAISIKAVQAAKRPTGNGAARPL